MSPAAGQDGQSGYDSVERRLSWLTVCIVTFGTVAVSPALVWASNNLPAPSAEMASVAALALVGFWLMEALGHLMKFNSIVRGGLQRAYEVVS